MTKPPTKTEQSEDFAQQAQMRQTGLLEEYLAFLREERKWWLVPILLPLLLAAGFVIVAGTAAAPFIYALF